MTWMFVSSCSSSLIEWIREKETDSVAATAQLARSEYHLYWNFSCSDKLNMYPVTLIVMLQISCCIPSQQIVHKQGLSTNSWAESTSSSGTRLKSENQRQWLNVNHYRVLSSCIVEKAYICNGNITGECYAPIVSYVGQSLWNNTFCTHLSIGNNDPALCHTLTYFSQIQVILNLIKCVMPLKSQKYFVKFLPHMTHRDTGSISNWFLRL